MLYIAIPIEPVSKKNSQRILINRKTGNPFVMPSVKYEHYQNDAGRLIRLQQIKSLEDYGITYPVNIKCKFYMSTRRRCDLTNLLESIDDILTHYGVITDDDYKHVAGHDGSRVYVDKEFPRTEIYITPIEGGD